MRHISNEGAARTRSATDVFFNAESLARAAVAEAALKRFTARVAEADRDLILPKAEYRGENV